MTADTVDGYAGLTEAATLLRLFSVALCVWREARGETLYGQQLVAQVVVNRVNDPRWPSSYVEVITQPYQFSSFNVDDPNALLFPDEDDPSWAQCVDAADSVLRDAADGEAPITTANHYHVRGCEPSWQDPAKVVAVEGAHIFYDL